VAQYIKRTESAKKKPIKHVQVICKTSLFINTVYIALVVYFI